MNSYMNITDHENHSSIINFYSKSNKLDVLIHDHELTTPQIKQHIRWVCNKKLLQDHKQISFNGVQKVWRDVSPSYLIVLAIDPKGTSTVVCKNYQMKPDCSLIITDNALIEMDPCGQRHNADNKANQGPNNTNFQKSFGIKEVIKEKLSDFNNTRATRNNKRSNFTPNYMGSIGYDLNKYDKSNSMTNKNQEIISMIKTMKSNILNKFQRVSSIGKGGFGKVYKMRERSTGELFAIKKIHIKDFNKKEILRTFSEAQHLSNISHNYVVKYYNSWRYKTDIYIQMELCAYNFQKLLKLKPKVFGRQPGDPMDCVEYFISCEIFKEILECVQYLHESKPQIIHRDLKPENILIVKNVRNGRFLKLCDFGLATVHDKRIHDRTSQKHTPDIGDYRYVALEIVIGKKYDHKSDIYSLARIGGEIFDVDELRIEPNSSPSYTGTNEILNSPVSELYKLLSSMILLNWTKRPECSQVLGKYEEWAINKNILTNDTEFDSKMNLLRENINPFFYEFLSLKLQ